MEYVTDDERILLHNVSYEQYVQVGDAFENRGSLRFTYADGMLEILTTGRRHQFVKTTVARLVEAHALLRDIRIYGIGNVTIRDALAEVGLEPDECYCVGTDKCLPDVAIEIVVSRRVNKLSIYARLGVREVWVYRRGQFEIHRLVEVRTRLPRRASSSRSSISPSSPSTSPCPISTPRCARTGRR